MRTAGFRGVSGGRLWPGSPTHRTAPREMTAINAFGEMGISMAIFGPVRVPPQCPAAHRSVPFAVRARGPSKGGGVRGMIPDG